MIRSDVAVTRLILLPYAGLLALYCLVVGAGGAWLYHGMREAETRLLIDDLMRQLEPLADELVPLDATASFEQREPWLIAWLRELFAELPALRTVSVRDRERGFVANRDGAGAVAVRATAALPADAARAAGDAPAAVRLHAGTDVVFAIRFDLTANTAPPVRLDFGFDRAQMRAQIDASLSTIGRVIVWFAVIGGLGILFATGITLVAMRVTRRIEGHFQELYRRASITELAAELVHDLRNPLMALRANVKALLVSPQQMHEIVAELDRDIVALNDKLSAFLNLTRRYEDGFEAVDLQELAADAVRIARPVLAQHGLGVETDIPADLPRPMLQRAAMRDALVNVLLNAARSGQQAGAIRIGARSQDGMLAITVDDSGEGIAQTDLPYLFDPYYTTRADGNGLGLAIVRRIVDAHNGRVRIGNRATGGTRVEFTLPLRQQEVPGWWQARKTISPV